MSALIKTSWPLTSTAASLASLYQTRRASSHWERLSTQSAQTEHKPAYVIRPTSVLCHSLKAFCHLERPQSLSQNVWSSLCRSRCEHINAVMLQLCSEKAVLALELLQLKPTTEKVIIKSEDVEANVFYDTYIYICAFVRHFYPKLRTLNRSYTFVFQFMLSQVETHDLGIASAILYYSLSYRNKIK